jgi:hypothetical protein
MKTLSPKQIPKEAIPSLKFGSQDVCIAEESRLARVEELKKAQVLGNLMKQKVGIIFADKDGEVYKVETTIWSFGDSYVCLKSDICIPIHAILSID